MYFMKPIALVGATGNIGRASLDALAALGFTGPVRAASRRPEEAAGKLSRSGLDWHFFDFSQPDSFTPFLEGVEALFFIAPHKDPAPAALRLVSTAVQLGVKRLVYSSGRTTGDVPGRPMYRIEQAVRSSGLNWTVLRPGWFMQNFTGWLLPSIRRQRVIALPAGKAKTAFVDVRDVGAVVARVLTTAGHAGQTYELTGEEAFDHGEVAQGISRACGLAVGYEDVSEADFRKLATSWGWSADETEDTLFLYRLVREGKEDHPSPDTVDIIGKPARRLEDFFREYAELWRPN